jgi:20S proteasome alpha/beta subunit
MRDLLLQVYPHGSTDTLPFATMGSGSLAAMSVFESRYKEDLTVNVFSTCAFTILVIVFVLRGFTDNMILSYNVLPI